MNAQGLETITLIQIQNLALFLMHHVPVLWIITIIIIILDYQASRCSQCALLNVKWEDV